MKQVILKMLKIVGVGCEPRIGVILKMQKNWGGGGGCEPRRKSGVGWM